MCSAQRRLLSRLLFSVAPKAPWFRNVKPSSRRGARIDHVISCEFKQCKRHVLEAEVLARFCTEVATGASTAGAPSLPQKQRGRTGRERSSVHGSFYFACLRTGRWVQGRGCPGRRTAVGRACNATLLKERRKSTQRAAYLLVGGWNWPLGCLGGQEP